jgi:hypothetical protein
MAKNEFPENITTEELLAMADQHRNVQRLAAQLIEAEGVVTAGKYGWAPHPAVAIHRQATQTLVAIHRALRITQRQAGSQVEIWEP